MNRCWRAFGVGRLNAAVGIGRHFDAVDMACSYVVFQAIDNVHLWCFASVSAVMGAMSGGSRRGSVGVLSADGAAD